MELMEATEIKNQLYIVCLIASISSIQKTGDQLAERLGNRAINQKVSDSRPCQMTSLGHFILAWVLAKLLPAQSDLVGKVGLGGLSPENTISRIGAVRTNQIVSAGFI